MAKTDNFFAEMRLLWHNVFYGNDKITSIFSFNGTLSRSLGWATASVLYCMLQIINIFDIKILTYIFGLLIFYCVLALAQKRCRDFGSAGTFWIILVTALMLLKSSLYFLDTEDINSLSAKWQKVGNILYCFAFIPFLIPSKPEPDLNLRSPLLKYPLIYTAICWILAVITTAIVNHFAGI